MASVETTVTFEPADVRDWGRQNGFTVGDRGRFSDALLVAYRDAGSPTFEREAKVKAVSAPKAVEAKVYEAITFPADKVLTKREFAASLGKAQMGVRGRLPAGALAVIAEAEANGYVFAEPVVVSAKPRKVSLVHPDRVSSKAIVSVEPLPVYDVRNVKQWAAQNDIDVPKRGRLSRALVERWVSAGSPIVTVEAAVSDFKRDNESPVVTEARERYSRVTAPPVSTEAPVQVRAENNAYVLSRSADDADYMAPLVIGFSECSKCTRLVKNCACVNGPVPASYVNAVSEVVFNKDDLKVLVSA